MTSPKSSPERPLAGGLPCRLPVFDQLHHILKLARAEHGAGGHLAADERAADPGGDDILTSQIEILDR